MIISNVDKSRDILSNCYNSSVMTIMTHENGFLIRECCDGYFGLVVSKEELNQLGKELITIADGKKIQISYEPGKEPYDEDD